jgi:hypothetical protein
MSNLFIYLFYFDLGEGNIIKTYLFNQNGDEEASYKQSLGIQKLH